MKVYYIHTSNWFCYLKFCFLNSRRKMFIRAFIFTFFFRIYNLLTEFNFGGKFKIVIFIFELNLSFFLRNIQSTKKFSIKSNFYYLIIRRIYITYLNSNRSIIFPNEYQGILSKYQRYPWKWIWLSKITHWKKVKLHVKGNYVWKKS